MRTASDGALALREALDAEGGTVAGLLAEPEPGEPGDAGCALDEPGPAQIAATGPRTRGREHEYEVLLEMILEGYRLHYGRPAGGHDAATRIWRCCWAISSTRSGWPVWPRSATSTPWPSSPT